LINPSLYNDVQMILTQLGTRRGFYAKIPAYNYLLAQKDAAVLALCPLRSLVSFSDPRRPRSICTSYTRQSFNYINAAYPVSVWRDADYSPRYQQQLIHLFTYSVLPWRYIYNI